MLGQIGYKVILKEFLVQDHPVRPGDVALAPGPCWIMTRPKDLDNCGVYLDIFHSCSSMKGRLRAYYRDGSVHTCMPHWNDFWFCITSKFKDDSTVQMEYIERLGGRERMNTARSEQPLPHQVGIWSLRSQYENNDR